MNTPKPNTRYKCYRNAPIEIEMNPTTHSLMAYVPYKVIGEDIEGRHSVTLGQKDGTPMEKNINSLLDAFKATEIWELPEVPLPETEVNEFDLSDYKPASDTNKYAGFSWFNLPRVVASQDEAKAMWAEKMALFSRKPAGEPAPVVNPPADPPKRKPGRPAKVDAAKVWNLDSVSRALCAKNGIEYDSKDPVQVAAAEKLYKEVYFVATDEVCGKDSDPSTQEQWNKVAEKLGL